MKIFLLILLMGFGVEAGQGQDLSDRLTKDANIGILTVGPAEPAFSVFGHTAIRVQDSAAHIDRVYNYGTFNPEVSGFYWKFLYGSLDYYLSVIPYSQFVKANKALGRSIVSQTLDLSPAEVHKLANALERNMEVKNRAYQYHFFSQNCVTEVVDLLARENIWLPDNQITATSLTGATYRQKTNAYLSGRPWMKLGVNLMLAAPADQRPDRPREQNALPSDLHLALTGATQPSGELLIKSEKTIATAVTKEKEAIFRPLMVFWVAFLIIVALTSISVYKGWELWWLDRAIFGIIGLLGIIIAIGSFVSLHKSLNQNWNLLWALPTHLFIAVGVKTMSRNKWYRLYFWVVLLLNIFVLAGWTFIPQQLPNPIIPLLYVLIIRLSYRLYSGYVTLND